MTINIIAAVAENRAIGLNGKLLYRLPNDMRRFRQLTTGNTVVMGRNTFLSLPKGALPNRRNIVLTTTLSKIDGCECFASMDDALKTVAEDEDVYIIGGASVYEEALHKADRLCLTEVMNTPSEADTFFPSYRNKWQEVWREHHEADERHAVPYDFVDYVPYR